MSAALRWVPAVILALETAAASILVADIELVARSDWETFGGALPAPTQFLLDFGVHFLALIVAGGATACAMAFSRRSRGQGWSWFLIPLPAPLIAFTLWASTRPYSDLASALYYLGP